MILINNYMSRRDTRMPWILPYVDRAKVSRKYRDTVKQINNCRLAGEWEFVKMLKRKLRRVWWGTKRYKK